MNVAIAIKGLSKVYRRGWRGEWVSALNDVSLEVLPGEAFGYIGPNGAGKTTTIKILTGSASRTSGELHLFGRPISDPESRRGVAYVPENPSLYDYLTPMEILIMGLRLHKVEVADESAHCRRWLERFEIARVANKPIKTFSKGMTQRTALAHALAIRPRLMILDEPLSGLDPLGRRDVVEILAEFKREGGTLFFTSHVLHDVERLADRFGLIHQGKLTAVRSPAELSGGEETVVVRTLGKERIQLANEDFPGRWSAEVHRKDLWSYLETIKGAGHVLIEVKPTLSLESAFMKAVGRDERV